MLTVRKYGLRSPTNGGTAGVFMPEGAKILELFGLSDIIYLATLVDMDKDPELNEFIVIQAGAMDGPDIVGEYVGQTAMGKNDYYIFRKSS